MSKQETDAEFGTRAPKGIKNVFERWMKFIEGSFENFFKIL